jgi:hypothetical protein
MLGSMKHVHHIIPKHMGGTDAPSNLIQLPIWAHAEVHKRLWEIYNRLEDKLAWCALSGKTEEMEKLRVEISKQKYKKWYENNPEEVENWKLNISNSLKGKRYLPDEHYQKVGNMLRGIPRSQEVKNKISEAKKGKSVAQPNQMKTYQITKPNGDIVIVRGLNEFCKSEGINASNLCAVVKGRLKHHKGYFAKIVE